MRLAFEKVGPLDGLVNCAAWSFHKPFSETTVAEFDRVVAINQRAPFFLSQEFAEAVKRRRSRSLYREHCLGECIVGNPNLVAYASTKGALVAMGRGMAVELAPRIRVVTISPGAVLTKNSEDLIAEGQIAVEPMLDRFLVKRFITVEEIADLVAFLFGPPPCRLRAAIGSLTEDLRPSERGRVSGRTAGLTPPALARNGNAHSSDAVIRESNQCLFPSV